MRATLGRTSLRSTRAHRSIAAPPSPESLPLTRDGWDDRVDGLIGQRENGPEEANTIHAH
jgi:hypothetical protein